MENNKKRVLGIRQGDVVFIKAEKESNGGVEKKDKIVAEGELTGHAHRAIGNVTVLERGLEISLEPTEEFTIVHEEHKHLPLPNDFFKVSIENEYTPEGFRAVQD